MKRKIGNSGIEVAPLAFGGNVFGWTADEATSFSLLDRFVDAGMDLIDTADVYSRWAPGHAGGESESVIGKWLKRGGKRHRVIIATKVGMDMGEGRKGLRPDYIRQAVEASLRRLQTDYIDLYQAHADDPDTPLEDTLGAFADLVTQGKVRVIGASNYTAERLRQAADISRRDGHPSYQSLQPHYNLVERADFEAKLAPVCAAQGIGVIPYYSLASGFLTGKYRSQQDLGKSVRGQGVAKYLDARGMRILAALDEVGRRADATPAQVALAWLMAQPTITAPIASATSVAQLEQLIGAARLQLTQEDLDLLGEASAVAD
ncbi:Predicted oxidoreductase [Noviherbaspirillum humi]|uniref:Predicted oxidoreductase n=1 Tax=Noviherbaspirillum humi TaxID=1688639 RepID=A0A239EZL5_9BURK|nr:aldo/keto reductase [Noviherbaspirillum humi]SNS50035.1 Predicted oxidoreductase [Noviherbaspirillum humi]